MERIVSIALHSEEDIIGPDQQEETQHSKAILQKYQLSYQNLTDNHSYQANLIKTPILIKL